MDKISTFGTITGYLVAHFEMGESILVCSNCCIMGYLVSQVWSLGVHIPMFFETTTKPNKY